MFLSRCFSNSDLTFPQTRLPCMWFTCRVSTQEFKATMLSPDYFHSVGPSQSNESQVGRLQTLQNEAVCSRAERCIACRAQPYVFNLCPKCPVADWQEGSLTLHRKWWGLCPVCNGRLQRTHSHYTHRHMHTHRISPNNTLIQTVETVDNSRWTFELSVII